MPLVYPTKQSLPTTIGGPGIPFPGNASGGTAQKTYTSTPIAIRFTEWQGTEILVQCTGDTYFRWGSSSTPPGSLDASTAGDSSAPVTTGPLTIPGGADRWLNVPRLQAASAAEDGVYLYVVAVSGSSTTLRAAVVG